MWEVKRVLVQTKSDEDYLHVYLKQGWEPFAVTSTDVGSYMYHLRRKWGTNED